MFFWSSDKRDDRYDLISTTGLFARRRDKSVLANRVSKTEWGGCLFLTGLANFAFPAYGLTWLHAAGAIFGWAYNRVARRVGIRAP